MPDGRQAGTPMTACLTPRTAGVPRRPGHSAVRRGRLGVAAGADDEVGEEGEGGDDEAADEDQDGVVGDVQGVDGDVVDAFGDAEDQQGQGDGHQDFEGVEVHDHAQDLQDVAVGVLDEVEFGGAGPFGVADGHVADVVLVGQERDGDGGDAGEPGGQQPQVGQRDLAAERAQPGVQVGDLVVGQPLGEFADEPLGRDRS